MSDVDMLDPAGSNGSGRRGPVRPGNPGECVVCAAPVTGARWYCDEHRPAKPASVPRARTTTKKKAKQSTGRSSTSVGRVGRPSAGTSAAGRVSDTRATGTIAKLLIILTVILMTTQVRRHGMKDPRGDIAEDLALTDDEAQAIAAPIARWSNQTALGARVIGPIARNEDIVAMAYAVWQYQRRVLTYFDEHGRGAIAPIRPLRVQPAATPNPPFDSAGPLPNDGEVRQWGESEMPLTSAEEQVIYPREGFAPPGYSAVGEPLTLDERGFIAGTQ